MATSDVAIANRALTWISDDQITDFTQDTNAARAVAAVYADCRDGLIADYPWRFAMQRALLAADVITPAFGWQYSYPLPSNCFRIWQVAGQWALNNPSSGWGWTGVTTDGGVPAGYNPLAYDAWEPEGNAILTNIAGPLPIRYVQRIIDPTVFLPVFVDALTAKLALEIAPRITGSNGQAQDLEARFKEFIARAKRANALERMPQAIRDPLWTTARFRG